MDAFVDDGPLSAQDIDAAMRRFKKDLIERALSGELTQQGLGVRALQDYYAGITAERCRL